MLWGSTLSYDIRQDRTWTKIASKGKEVVGIEKEGEYRITNGVNPSGAERRDSDLFMRGKRGKSA